MDKVEISYRKTLADKSECILSFSIEAEKKGRKYIRDTEPFCTNVEEAAKVFLDTEEEIFKSMKSEKKKALKAMPSPKKPLLDRKRPIDYFTEFWNSYRAFRNSSV